ncbi:MAG: DUF4179 domain-containing protein [Candidatus Limivicinus sp.]
MEYRIVDLLDCIQDSDVPIRTENHASATKIKELTMEKINAENRKNKRPVRKAARVALIAAIIVLLLSVTAFAANELRLADLFREVFGQVSESQEEVMEEISVPELPEAVTSQGTTITPVAAIVDEYMYYIRFQIEAPEGTVLNLPAPEAGALQICGQPGNLLRSDAYLIPYSTELSWIDNSPGDNRFDLIIQIIGQYGGEAKFNDGISKTLKIDGIWTQSLSQNFTKILDGVWEFEIGTVYPQVIKKELDTAGITTVCPDTGYTVRLDRMSISPLCLSREYSYEEYQAAPGMPDAPGPGYTAVVMKDGSEAEIVGVGMGTSGKTAAKGYYYFAAPIDIDQVAYIQWGDVQIPVN